MHALMSPLSLSGMTADSVTDSDIRDLQTEAGEAGDRAQVALCRKALAGDRNALSECEAAVMEARAAR
jgi:hypothetical protein